MIIYKDFYTLFEKYCIMSEQPDNTEKKVLQYLKQRTTKSLFEMLLTVIGEK